MAEKGIPLKEQDRKRLIKDRIIRAAVTCGGLSVLAALILIFVYLVMMVMPLFSASQLKPNVAHQLISSSPHSSPASSSPAPLAMRIDNSGQYVYSYSASGKLALWHIGQGDLPAQSWQISEGVTAFSRMVEQTGWLASADAKGQVTVFKPAFAHHYQDQSMQIKAKIDYPAGVQGRYSLTRSDASLRAFTFAVDKQQVTIAGDYSDGTVEVRWYHGRTETHQSILPLTLPHQAIDQLLMTPDGKTLYLRSGNQLTVAVMQGKQFKIRETVDLQHNHQGGSIKNIQLLAGAYSLLVTDSEGNVSQWFDVLKQQKRSLTYIRSFHIGSKLKYILPDSYRKGFYAFLADGSVRSYYTTSGREATFKQAFSRPPQVIAISNNESYLATVRGSTLSVSHIHAYAPEISFSSLWRKVWYEIYPEPSYVWQTTSASKDFEAKYSFAPIVFGTLKAAVFAMLFSVPIAICGAIYTAYFMSVRMRGVVKPSIELMEALPTVIIGFLAGLWFAPIVEANLVSVVSVMVLLPPFIILIGFGWRFLPPAFLQRCPNGLHPIILMPLIALFTYFILLNGSAIEFGLFHGDVRVFLAEHGIDYDQRNALVVGFAMGFAVIPTIFTIAEDAVFSVPKHLSDGSLALGATPWQTLTNVVLFTASPGIFSAVMMGLGRAVGETMIVLMATGNTPIMDWNILEGMRTLSATIAVEMPESEVGSPHFRLLFLAALLLLIFTFAVNSLAEWVRQRLRDKYRAM